MTFGLASAGLSIYHLVEAHRWEKYGSPPRYSWSHGEPMPWWNFVARALKALGVDVRRVPLAAFICALRRTARLPGPRHSALPIFQGAQHLPLLLYGRRVLEGADRAATHGQHETRPGGRPYHLTAVNRRPTGGSRARRPADVFGPVAGPGVAAVWRRRDARTAADSGASAGGPKRHG